MWRRPSIRSKRGTEKLPQAKKRKRQKQQGQLAERHPDGDESEVDDVMRGIGSLRPSPEGAGH